jgi:hypothetical protein
MFALRFHILGQFELKIMNARFDRQWYWLRRDGTFSSDRAFPFPSEDEAIDAASLLPITARDVEIVAQGDGGFLSQKIP